MDFDGTINKRNISLAGASRATKKDDLVKKSREDRAARQQDRTRVRSAVKIQSLFRNSSKKREEVRQQWSFPSLMTGGEQLSGRALLKPTRELLFFYRGKTDADRLELLLRVIFGTNSGEFTQRHLTIGTKIDDDTGRCWCHQVSRLLNIAADVIGEAASETSKMPMGHPLVKLLLQFWAVYTSASAWNIEDENLKAAARRTVAWIFSQMDPGRLMRMSGMVLVSPKCHVETENVERTVAFTVAARALMGDDVPDSARASLTRNFCLHVLSIPHLSKRVPPAGFQQPGISGVWLRCMSYLESDSSVIDALQKMRSTTWKAVKHKPSTWLLANVVDIVPKTLQGAADSVILSYVHVLQAAVRTTRDLDVAATRDKVDPDLFAVMQTIPSKEHIILLFKRMLLGNMLPMTDGASTLSTLDTAVCELHVTMVHKLPSLRQPILNSISFSYPMLRCLWNSCVESGLVQVLKQSGHTDGARDKRPLAILALFLNCFSHLLLVLDDEEMYEKHKPFSLADLGHMTLFLNNYCLHLLWKGHITTAERALPSLPQSAITVLAQLRERNDRREFLPSSSWHAPEITPGQFLTEATAKTARALAVMQDIPHVLPYENRIHIFRALIEQEKEQFKKKYLVRIRRQYVVEDGLTQLTHIPNMLKGIVQVIFVNEHGLEEAGIDQNGVFKEFMEVLVKKMFDPRFGLFLSTSEKMIVPSPQSSLQYNHLQLFEFVGMILGKAVYEGIVLDLPFPRFFYSKLLGRYNYLEEDLTTVQDLVSLDPDLHKNLMFLKHYEGDAEDLSLDFTVTNEVLGEVQSHELCFGGSRKSVTNDNKISYIHMMADFRLNKQTRQQCEAFRKGFNKVMNPTTLKLFNTPHELQRLICGDSSDIDVDDWMKYTQYSNGYYESHRIVKWFWQSVREFTLEERRALLKFVTSCGKPPLLGFKFLDPPFTIHQVITSAGNALPGLFGRMLSKDSDRLPSSSTCFNFLKLPSYGSKKNLKDRLLYAIHSNAGFELS